MDFNLTEDQQMIKEQAADFAERFLAPTIEERDKNHVWDRKIINEMIENGFQGICFPEEYGGAGMDVLSYILAVEEMSKVDDGTGITLSASVSLCATPIYMFGTEEQKQKYLTPICEGRTIGAFGLTEPSAGTDASAQQTTAVLKGDKYILNGSKIFITNGSEAETYVIFAMTDKSAGVHGISAFIVEKGMPGFRFGKIEDKMGGHTSLTAELIFEDCEVPKENLLGKEGEGFKIAMMTLDGGRVGVGAQALGIAEGAYNAALQYAKERTQFGKQIAKFQAVSFMLADMKLKIETARLAVYKAAWKMSQPDVKSYSVDAAIAKKYASDVAMQVTTDAVQVFGGYGFTREYPVERYMRDAKITQIYEGTNQVQQMVISGAILR